MLRSKLIKKENIDFIFKTLTKEYLRLNGSKRVDIYMVGGAAIVLSFEYRASTIDIDAFYTDNHILELAIENTSKELNLPNDWLNKDFTNTPSYSPKIKEKANLYASYFDIVFIYTLEPKYLIAMKLKSSRPTGGDLDDIIKMIYELRYKGEKITYEEVLEAYKEMYSHFSNTYNYFLEEAKKAFETPVEDFEFMFKRY